MENIKLTAVCEYCQHHDKSPHLEIDFSDKHIYYACPECKKMNKIEFNAKAVPLPRSRRL